MRIKASARIRDEQGFYVEQILIPNPYRCKQENKMATITESTHEHGKIDLNDLIRQITQHIREDFKNLLIERDGRIYVVTDEIIRRILENKGLTQQMRREGQLFSNMKDAYVISTLPKNEKVLESQMKQIGEMEELIYEALRSKLSGNAEYFFGQSAASYFDEFGALRKGWITDIHMPQIAAFPDAGLSKKYPGGIALMLVPRHTITINSAILDVLTDAIKKTMRTRLEEWDSEDIDEIFETVDKGLKDNVGHLSDLMRVLDRDTYGRIRRTYACVVLGRMADNLDDHSPAIPYIRRVSDFNELVQGALPESGLTGDDLVLEFPSPDGKGTTDFDLTTEFAYADALDKLPFWVTFDELLSETSVEDSVTTTMGQHLKMNGRVENRGFGSVYEYNIDKLKTMADTLRNAASGGERLPDENDIRKVLRIAVMYYVVFRGDSAQKKNALTNYKEFKTHLPKLLDEKLGLEEILNRLFSRLHDKNILDNNRRIGQDLKKLLKSRRQDDLPAEKQKLWFMVSRNILTDKSEEMEKGEPVKPPPSKDHVTSYLRYLKISSHPGQDYDTLIKEPIRFTEWFRYLTLPDGNQRQRGMRRDMERQVLGVILIPRNNGMNYFSMPLQGLGRLVISYDRKQLYGMTGEDFQSLDKRDENLSALARLIYVLLSYGVLKAVARLEDDIKANADEQAPSDKPQSHGDKTMLMLLSLFSTTLPKVPGEREGFTHDAHKAVEHVIKQHMPTKSQGFMLKNSEWWDRSFLSGKWKEDITERKNAAADYIRRELKDHRFGNIMSGLSSGLDALWQLPEEPGIKKIALLSVTSRACDRLRKRSQDDRSVMFGDIHRFEHETADAEKGGYSHFYRHRPVQAFCDHMGAASRFRNPSLLFGTVRKLYEEGFRDVIIVTKVPFTRRIRMSTYDDSTYTNTLILRKLHDAMPDIRIYPLFTQKSFGVRLSSKENIYPMFLPHDPANDGHIHEAPDNSSLIRVASVLTYRIVGRDGSQNRIHSGITDYLFRCHQDLTAIQSRAVAAVTNPGKDQECLYEILRFLHSDAYQKSTKKTGREKALEAKLDAFETTIGDKSVGQQAEVLQFPKPSKNTWPDAKTYRFSVNILAMLKHLENQSDQYRKKRGGQS